MATMTKTKGKGALTGAMRVLSVERDLLLGAIAFAMTAIKGATTLPVLHCVRLRLKEGASTALVVEGTNLDQYVETSVPCDDLTQEFERAEVFHSVPAKLLHSALGRCPKGQLSITVSAGRIMLGGFTIVTLPGDEFPECPKFEAASPDFSLDGTILARCARFATLDQSRYVLMGVHLDGGYAIASDGRRAHMERLGLPDDVKVLAFLPCDFAHQCARMEEPVLTIGNEKARARGQETGNPAVTTKQMDAGNRAFIRSLHDFMVIDKAAVQLTMDKLTLIDALQSAELMAEKESRAISLMSDDGEGLTIGAETMDRGAFVRTIPVTGEAFSRVRCSVVFLLQAVNAFADLPGDEITLHVLSTPGGSKIWIKAENRSHILMCMSVG